MVYQLPIFDFLGCTSEEWRRHAVAASRLETPACVARIALHESLTVTSHRKGLRVACFPSSAPSALSQYSSLNGALGQVLGVTIL